MNTNDLPLVSIIIPHWKGKEILVRCLSSLAGVAYQPVEVLLVDNGSRDASVDEARKIFPSVDILRSETNLGFAGGCNLGLRAARGAFSLLLNDDAVVTRNFLGPLVDCMKKDDLAAACQPKILSLKHPGFFDYAGAAGGYLDLYGFPFCRGRVFDTIEADKGQYDSPEEIFWASGACCLLRMSAVMETGLLDEDFFAHMEEIDLQWRMRNKGYSVRAVSSSVVHHDAGSTLAPDNPDKVYLNHRNSLVMLIKNHDLKSLFVVFSVRILLDAAAVVYRFARCEPLNAFAIIRARLYVLFHLPDILRKRKEARPSGIAASSLYSRSIVWDYYVMKRKTASRLRSTRERDDG